MHPGPPPGRETVAVNENTVNANPKSRHLAIPASAVEVLHWK